MSHHWFRGLRSTAALASTPTTANASSASSRRTATTTPEPMHDSAGALQAGASGVDAGSACSEVRAEAASTEKRMVSALGDASSPDRTRCRRGARGGGLDVAQSVPGSVSMGDGNLSAKGDVCFFHRNRACYGVTTGMTRQRHRSRAPAHSGIARRPPRLLSAWACLDSFSTETEQAGLTQASPELPTPPASAEVAEGVRARDGGDGSRSR